MKTKFLLAVLIVLMYIPLQTIAQLNLSLFDEIETNGANDLKSFKIGSETFLAVANYRTDPTTNVDSKIYKWNGNSFDLEQSISTSGASDFEFFEIEGSFYLAVANYRSDSSANEFYQPSNIYEWDGTQFMHYQSIYSNGAYDIEYFETSGDHYLAFANQTDGSSNNIDSKIFVWQADSFVLHQNIGTVGATDWESFHLDGNTYLVDASVYNMSLPIYKMVNNQFVIEQSLISMANTNSEFFEIDGRSFLAVTEASAIGIGPNFQTFDTDSWIYEWNGSEFTAFQSIASTGAFDWEYFSFNGQHYLGLSNYQHEDAGTPGAYQQLSKIFKWDGANFIEELTMLTDAAVDMEFFIIGNRAFLGISEYKGYNNEHSIQSRIFEFDEAVTSTSDLLENDEINLSLSDDKLMIQGVNMGCTIELIDLKGKRLLMDRITSSGTHTVDLTQVESQMLLIKVLDSNGNYLFSKRVLTF